MARKTAAEKKADAEAKAAEVKVTKAAPKATTPEEDIAKAEKLFQEVHDLLGSAAKNGIHRAIVARSKANSALNSLRR